MWQLHRLEVDAVPPTSYECGHITWKWAKSHTDQASTTDTHTCAQRKRCCDVKSSDCDCDCVCVAGHANSRVFVGQHFRLRSGGGFNAIWGLWSWPPPNQTSFKCAVVTARLHLLLLFSVFFFSLHSLSQQMSFCGQLAMCAVLIDTSAYLPIVAPLRTRYLCNSTLLK